MDACVEGMRKFTTEVFDTGVALLGYVALLFWYDWRLALLSLLFPPLSYVLAEKMKKTVQRTGSAFKESSARLSDATLDRVSGAAPSLPRALDDQRAPDPVFWGAQCQRHRVPGMGHCRFHHLFILLFQAVPEILVGCQAL